MWRCAHDGHVRSVLSEKKFGKAKRHTMNAVSRIPAAFHRVKNNIDTIVLVTIAPRQPRIWRSARAIVLHRLALGPHLGNHRAHLAQAGAVGYLDLDLIVVDDLRDLTDQPAIGHHGIAAAKRLDHRLVLLHALLLRTQDQKIHNHDDQKHTSADGDDSAAVDA